jgi:HAD superfamily hydrolase (TIGR01509 family)
MRIDIFLVAAKKLGLEPSECIVFEDSAAGIEVTIQHHSSVFTNNTKGGESCWNDCR